MSSSIFKTIRIFIHFLVYTSTAIAHTLWTPMNNTNRRINTSEIIVHFSTTSEIPIEFITSMTRVTNFSVQLNASETFTVAHSEPVIYYFKFENFDMALITVTSKDERICMTFSIQNCTHEVFDTLLTVQNRELRQTVSKNGGIIVSKQEYPFGLLLVFVVHSSNELCASSSGLREDKYEGHTINKTVTLNINRTVNFHLKLWIWVTIASSFLCLLIFTLFFCNGNNDDWNCNNKSDKNKTAANGKSTVGSDAEVNIENNCSISYHSSLEDLTNMTPKVLEERRIVTKLPNEFKRLNTLLFVSDLSSKNYRSTNFKSRLFLWNLITVAIFYSLPVIQLVFSYQKMLNDYGKQDLCYFNFFCSHALIIGDFKLSDFNHIFSNIGYVFFGLLFIIITYKHERAYSPKINFGIPPHIGLYYSMGAALALEGLMSACYHVCPNYSNFQFDTSFMYIICMLSIVKIYQSRHPDINAASYLVYAVLAIVILLGLIGILVDNGWLFRVIFTCIHLAMCIWLSTYIYYVGYWKMDKTVLKKYKDYLMSRSDPYKPKFMDRLVLLVIGILINFALDVTLIVSPDMFDDFPNYLLALFLVNLILYLFFYIVMKWKSNERLNRKLFLFIFLAVICWSAALYFYINKTSAWNLSPAESRELNHKCVLWELFDYHDIWHFLSAISMFCSFMVLLILDEDLVDKPTAYIPVF